MTNKPTDGGKRELDIQLMPVESPQLQEQTYVTEGFGGGTRTAPKKLQSNAERDLGGGKGVAPQPPKPSK